MSAYIAHPYDVLFFRGNKSFTFGEWYTEGTFPPAPSTFQGFVRSKILRDNGVLDEKGKIEDKDKIKELVGDDDNLTIEIVGPYLIKEESSELYFPTPMDIIREDEGCRSLWNRFSEGRVESDLDFSLYMPAGIPEKKLETLKPANYVSGSEMTAYRLALDGLQIEGRDLVFTEDRVGIGLDYEELSKSRDRKTKDRRFYVTPYSRLLDGIDLYFSITGAELMNGSQKLGGEAHLVDIVRYKEESLLEIKFAPSRRNLIESIANNRTFRLLLLQPGIFKQGWMPFLFQMQGGKLFASASCNGKDLRLELLATYMEAPQRIGGYSYMKNTGTNSQIGVTLKPMVLAVPAGSVYLFRIEKNAGEKEIVNFVEGIDNKKIEYLHYSLMGFNHVLLACGPRMGN